VLKSADHPRKVVFGGRSGGRSMKPVGESGGQRSRDRIASLAIQGLDVATFFREAGLAVSAVIPSAGMPTWFTLDPASLLITSYQRRAP
jgi:hypothetical protein